MTTITALTETIAAYTGAAASRSQDQATFNTNMAYLAGYIAALGADVNLAVADINSRITEFNTVVAETNASAAAAAASETAAENAAGLVNYQGAWSAGTYTLGQSVLYNNTYWISNQAANADTPSVASSKWDVINLNSSVTVAVPALDIDCVSGAVNDFTKTIAGASTFTVSNVPASGVAFTFILMLTHTSGTITWFSGISWMTSTGLAPDTVAGNWEMSFTTRDGGTTWNGAAVEVL